MEPRINVHEKGQNALKTLHAISAHLKKSTLEQNLLELVMVRVSQINACAYCLDMHSKDARAKGETEQRIYGLSAWRDTPYYSERERAALGWAEAVTKAVVPDDVYNETKKQFSDEEMIDLTFAIAKINTWNRINLAFPSEAGTYKVGQFG